MTRSAVVFACLCGLALVGCGSLPSGGPSADQLVGQGRHDGGVVFDVVKVDEHVLATLAARPQESFALRFDADKPPALRIAVGDTISVVIWEAGAGGLFTEPAPQVLPSGPPGTIEPLEETPSPGQPPATAPSPLEQLLQTLPQGEAQPQRPPGQPPGMPGQASPAPAGQGMAELQQALQGAANENVRNGVEIPDQQVGADGGISVPFAGRVPAAGRTPDEVRQIIEQRLAGKGLQPQALVLDKNSPANAVTVAGEVVHGGRIPLSPEGNRLLQVIAEAGGAGAPMHEVFVRLSRGGVTATVPLQTLVDQPAEDIYARPGDVLTLVRIPRMFTVFGGAGKNDAVEFDAAQLSLSEALAQSGGLDDQRADPGGVFLFRYEPVSLVRALDQPIAAGAPDGASPIVYRFDMFDPKSYLLAKQFPVQDKDVIFVADAAGRKIYQFVKALSEVVGPVESGLIVCINGSC